MYPEIIRIGDFVISSYGLMMVIAFLVGNYWLRSDLAKCNYSSDVADEITFRAAIGGIIGAKLYYLIENIPSGIASKNISGLVEIFIGIFTINLEKIAFGIQNFGAGMVFLGGFIGGFISVYMYVRSKGLKFLQISDLVAPFVVLGHSIGRIGCFLVGDDYGRPTNLPWGVKFSNGLPISNAGNLRQILGEESKFIDSGVANNVVLACHPTQLYEMILYLFIFLYLKFFIAKKPSYDGRILFEYLFLASFVRLMVEFIRLNRPYIFGLSGAQLISIILILVSSIFMWNSRKLNSSFKN